NALSEWMRVEVRKDGGLYRQEYMEGVPLDPVERVGDTPEPNGTTVTFMADRTIFTTIDYNFDTLAQRFREMAYLTKGLTIKMLDQRPEEQDARPAPGGRAGVDLLLRRRHRLVRAPPEFEPRAAAPEAVLRGSPR